MFFWHIFPWFFIFSHVFVVFVVGHIPDDPRLFNRCSSFILVGWPSWMSLVVVARAPRWGPPTQWCWWEGEPPKGRDPLEDLKGMKKISQYQVTTWRYWRDWSEEWAKLLVASERFNLQGATCHSSNFHTFSIYIYIFCKKFKVITVGFSVSWHCRSDSLAGKVWTLLGSWTINWSPMWPSIREDVFVTYTVWFESLLYIFAKVGTLVSQHHHSLSLLDNQTPSERFRQVLDM